LAEELIMSLDSKQKAAMTVVEGMLKGSAGGGAVGGGTGPETWDLIFHLMPWKRHDQEDLPKVQLRVLVPISKSALRAEMKRLADGAAVRFTVKSLEPPADQPWWLATGTFPVDRLRDDQVDAALREAKARLDRPVVLQDPVLGAMTLKRDLDWFTGHRRHAGLAYDVSVLQASGAEDRDADERHVRQAGTVVERFEAGMASIRDAIVRKMLPLYNETWRKAWWRLSGERFSAKIQLTSAVIGTDGVVVLYFDDGGLFAGHTIEVRLDAAGGVREVCLAG
jgi:hypothetical protein